jgi:hypothetical protein
MEEKIFIKKKFLFIFFGIFLIFLTFINEIPKINSFQDFNPKFELDDSYIEYIKFHENKENEEKDFLNISQFADELIMEKSQKEKTEEIEKSNEKRKKFNLDDNCLNSNIAEKNATLSDNQKFILGKCNPVLFVPGFISTRLVANIDCPNLINDKVAFDELRFFCGEKICNKGFFSYYKKEEYTLWPALFDNPFKLYIDNSNPDNSCLAYVMRIFNSEEECPKLYKENNPNNKEDLKQFCVYNKYINVTFSGNTENTKGSLQCGVKPISRILDPGFSLIPESSVNGGSSAVYYELSESLRSRGYKEGFSMAGLPYDFRTLSKKDSDFSLRFTQMVEMLYKNTGKKVIITSHSQGNIFTNDVLVNSEFKEKLENMIERNIAILPPYIGTSKDTELFLTGSKEFKVDIFAGMKVDVSNSALKFTGAFNPNFYILFLKPFLENLSNKSEYKNFLEAILERINLERHCKNLIGLNNDYKNDIICNDDFIEKNSKKFSEIFPFIPKLNSKECKDLYISAENDMKNSDFFNKKNNNRDDIYEYLPTYDPCFLRIFDFLNCPMIKVNRDNKDFSIEDFEKICLNLNENIEEKNKDKDKEKGKDNQKYKN